MVETRPSELPTWEGRWLLTALQYRGVGVAAVRKFASLLVDPKNKDITIDDAINLLRLRLPQTSAEDVAQAESKALRIIEACGSHAISIISILDPQYPIRLRAIRDAPPIIYVRGSLSALTMSGCAVVGTRNASKIGLEIARRIAKVLTTNNLSTVSGLALGIDAAGHTGALDAGGITVAIMAHGLDTISPTTNKKIAERLLETGGALISEHEPKVPPRPAEFVRRNRIQSGMSLCSIIVESGREGGSMHQARFTKEQGHPIFAVLPEFKSQTEFNAEGGELLVSSLGAIRLRTAEELELHLSRMMAEEQASPRPQFDLRP